MSGDYQDWQTPDAHAASIYNQRVPLARASTSIGAQTGRTLLHNSGFLIVVGATVDQPSFEFVFNAQLPAAAGGIPFVRLQFTWIDTIISDETAFRTFILASGDGVGNRVRLLGPSRGDTVSVNATNLHATQDVTFDWSMSLVSYVTDSEDYATDREVSVSGFTPPGGDPSTGTLAVIDAAITPATPLTRLLVATNRLCKITVDNTGQANAVDVQVSDPEPSVPLYGSSAGALFWRSGSVAAGAVLNGEYQMPNGPALVTVTNLGGAGNITPKVSITTTRT